METTALKEENLTELNKFLNFFKTKKDESLKELDLDYKDFIEYELKDNIYNKEDVNTLIIKMIYLIIIIIKKNIFLF